ncbi:MAG: DUF370 domain-containing protein [Clostridia bacterium]|nr:DUF370 domain-containing protein [Clostridia bacterium]MBQ2500246.1 DUF370 domain-containing protein [Clostridia bacterium]MBQ3897320.1 DUF370 domain-containing protein [Clostridia bacterium]
MFLHLGQSTVIRTDDIVGVFDIDNTTVSKHTRNYLANATKSGKIVNVSLELPKSFIVCRDRDGEETVYISQLSPATLLKRFSSNSDGGYKF